MNDHRMRVLAGVGQQPCAETLRRLDEPTIRIYAPNLSEWRHQVLLFVLVDLLGRVFPRLDIAADMDTPADPALPPGGATVGDRLAAVRQRSPLQPLAAGKPVITMHIGPGESGADLFIDASEWQSYLGQRPSRLPSSRRDTAIGPLSAACRAGAMVYSRLLRHPDEQPVAPVETYASALTYEISSDPLIEPEPPAVGPVDALLVGGGSVGGACALALSLEPEVTGRLIVCDPEKLDETNPYRAILATASAAASQAAKADVIKAALSHHGALCVDAQVKTITEWEADHDGQQTLPLVLVAVDTREAREQIQDALPLEVVNAAVGTQLVALSGHRTGTGPCMCCLHMPDVLDARQIKNRLIADSTGFDQRQVNALRVQSTKLDDHMLRTIEQHRCLESGDLEQYAGKTLDDLYNAEILYGETKVETSSGATVAVAAPFVTTLAGVLLAGEAFKRCTQSLREYALGPGGREAQYREDPYSSEHGYLDGALARSPVCLCRSVRRLRVLADLHDLQIEALHS